MKKTVSEKRNYLVKNTNDAKKISKKYLKQVDLEKVIQFGLPEVDDRYHIWRVPLVNSNSHKIGEIVIDTKTSLIDLTKTTTKDILEKRLLGRKEKKVAKKQKLLPLRSSLINTIGLGDSEDLLATTPNESINLIFTSPPYFNARIEYSDYVDYDDYLNKMRKIIRNCHRVLSEGRFFVINISPILLRRAKRSESSKRIAVPFDFHRIFIEEGFDFIDDIIWVKPSGAGWATGRGRRFAADRNPLQYKAVPVTEYVLVYRKKSEYLIDWSIRNHPDKKALEASKIADDYEKTNVWNINPAYTKKHPAVFPIELAQKVIKYYSFIDDVVLDPFAGIGTVGKAAVSLERRFVLFEAEKEYIENMVNTISEWGPISQKSINWINCKPPKQESIL
jgi:DNA modification methylase